MQKGNVLYFFILGLVVCAVPATAHADCTNPHGVSGQIMYNADYDVFQGCTANRGWMAFHGPTTGGSGGGESTGCPNIGDECSDGTYYAGLSPDGNVAMYAAASDESGYLAWGSGGTSRGTTSTSTGEANTATLASFGQSAHPAAHACANLTAHGHDDWYLPARYELSLLWNGGSPIAGVVTSGSGFDVYWTSTEVSSTQARMRSFQGSGTDNYSNKGYGFLVRCVRKE